MHHFKAIGEFKLTKVTIHKYSISDQNLWFFVLCDIQIWRITLKNNRTPFLYCFKPRASFHSHQWIETWVTVRQCSIWVKIRNIFVPCDLEIGQMTLKNNRAPLLCYFKLCAPFRSHWGFQTGAVWKCPIWVKIYDFLSCMTLKFDGLPWKNRAPLLSKIKFCASFHHHIWIQTGVRVQKWLTW